MSAYFLLAAEHDPEGFHTDAQDVRVLSAHAASAEEALALFQQYAPRARLEGVQTVSTLAVYSTDAELPHYFGPGVP